MAIYKKIKGEDTRVASNCIIDHSQLSGRDGYGAHPISAIRRLPEKLTEHKKAIQDQKDALDQEIIDRKAAIQLEQEARENADTSIVNNTKRIALQEGENGTLIFTDYENNKVTVQGGYLPDDETIELQERYSQVTLDESSFVANKYYIFNNGEYILAQSYDPEATYYQVQDKMVAVGLNTGSNIISGQALSNDLTSIKSIINAKGGYLDSYNFGTASPSQQDLTQYAIQDIGDIETASEIWDKTRVINLFTSKQHPNQDTWVWDLNSLTWSNLGNISLISDANNSGLHGLVTGSQEDYEGFIDINGQIKVNGLPELSSKVDNLIVNRYSNTQDHTYSSKYSNEHFAPLSFISKLYLNKLTDTTASLIDNAPEGTNNYLNIISNNNSFDWNNSAFTVTRTLGAITTLNEETSFTLNLNFFAQQDCEIAFGAKIKVSTDNGVTWTTISSNQQYGQESYSGNTLSSTRFIVYTDALSSSTTYNIDDLLRIEVFIKGEDTSTLTNYIACGYEVDGSINYSYLQFNYQNIMISTDQIEDGAVTEQKLSTTLQNKIDGKVDKTTTIAGVDLQDNITKTELLSALNVQDGAQVNDVTGVKGNAESNYRIGNIDITPDNLSDLNTTNKFVTTTDVYLAEVN